MMISRLNKDNLNDKSRDLFVYASKQLVTDKQYNAIKYFIDTGNKTTRRSYRYPDGTYHRSLQYRQFQNGIFSMFAKMPILLAAEKNVELLEGFLAENVSRLFPYCFDVSSKMKYFFMVDKKVHKVDASNYHWLLTKTIDYYCQHADDIDSVEQMYRISSALNVLSFLAEYFGASINQYLSRLANEIFSGAYLCKKKHLILLSYINFHSPDSDYVGDYINKQNIETLALDTLLFILMIPELACHRRSTTRLTQAMDMEQIHVKKIESYIKLQIYNFSKDDKYGVLHLDYFLQYICQNSYLLFNTHEKKSSLLHTIKASQCKNQIMDILKKLNNFSVSPVI